MASHKKRPKARRKSKRPPKSWWKHCVANVRAAGSAVSAESVCGALWSRKMSAKKKRRAKKRHPESGRKHHKHR